MTVAELITALQAMPQDGVVVTFSERYGVGEVSTVEQTAALGDKPTYDSETLTIYTGPA